MFTKCFVLKLLDFVMNHMLADHKDFSLASKATVVDSLSDLIVHIHANYLNYAHIDPICYASSLT